MDTGQNQPSLPTSLCAFKMPDGSPPGETCHHSIRGGAGMGRHALLCHSLVFINHRMVFLWTLTLCFSPARPGRAPGKATQLHRRTHTPQARAGTWRVLHTTRVRSPEKSGAHRQAPRCCHGESRGEGRGFREADPSEPFSYWLDGSGFYPRPSLVLDAKKEACVRMCVCLCVCVNMPGPHPDKIAFIDKTVSTSSLSSLETHPEVTYQGHIQQIIR